MGIGGFIKDHWKDIATVGGTIYGARKANQAEHQADALQQQYIQQMEREYEDRAPLRSQGTAGLLAAEQPYQMGNIGYDASNPFSRRPTPGGNTAITGRAALGAPVSYGARPIQPGTEGPPDMKNMAPGFPQPTPAPIPTALPPGGTPSNDNQHYYRDPNTGQVVPKPMYGARR